MTHQRHPSGHDLVEQEATTRTIDVAEAGPGVAWLIDEVSRSQTRVIVRKGDLPVAAIISAKDLELFNRLVSEREKDFELLAEIGDAFKDESPEEIERQAAKALTEVRKEARRQEHGNQRP